MGVYCTPGDRGGAPAGPVFGEVVGGAEAVTRPGGVRTGESGLGSQDSGVSSGESALYSQGGLTDLALDPAVVTLA